MNSIFRAIFGASIAGATLLALAAPASAEILFRGIMKVTALTAACTGISVGDRYNAQFHPGTVAGNSNFSALNKIYDYGATSWRIEDGGPFTTAFQQVSNESIGWSAFTPDQPSFVLISKQAPATITDLTTSITLEGRVKNFYGNTGQENCIANFRMVGLKDVQ